MYKKVKTDEVFYTATSDHTPFVTLANEYGGRAQISDDDGCYVLYMKGSSSQYYVSVKHWFPEAARELKRLPDNARRMRRFDFSGQYIGMRQSYTTIDRIFDFFSILKKTLRIK